MPVVGGRVSCEDSYGGGGDDGDVLQSRQHRRRRPREQRIVPLQPAQSRIQSRSPVDSLAEN